MERRHLLQQAGFGAAAVALAAATVSPARSTTPSTTKDTSTMSPKLTRTNTAVMLVDHQQKLVAGSRIPDPEALARNSVGLVRAAKILGLPSSQRRTARRCSARSFRNSWKLWET